MLYPVELRALQCIGLEGHPVEQADLIKSGDNGRGRRIRTADPLLPKQMRYQTEESYKANKNATVVIKSTVPVGYTRTMKAQYPEILSFHQVRERVQLFQDNLYPSRIIIGGKSDNGKKYFKAHAGCCYRRRY